MEGKTGLRDTKPLIDLSSPLAKRQPVKLPLTPQIRNAVFVSPTSNIPNPDVNINQTSSCKDPFEEVFVNAYCNLGTEGKPSLKSEGSQKSVNTENKKTKDNADDLNLTQRVTNVPVKESSENTESEKVVNEIVTTGTELKDNLLNKSDHNSLKEETGRFLINKNVECDELAHVFNISPIVPVVKPENIKDPHKSVKSEKDIMKLCPNKSNVAEPKSTSTSVLIPDGNDGQSQICSEFSSDDGIKAMIAKRVNKCIQRVLNNSIKSKINKSNDTGSKKTLNKRSLSFVTQSTRGVKCDRLNKSCEQFNLENEEMVSPDSSIETSDIRPLSPTSGEVSKADDSVFLPSEKDMVFEEANKLARTFSKLAESFCKMSEWDSEDDLLTCEPCWTYADSSEDEEEKLRRDPALNIRVSLTNSMTKQRPQPDSDALSAFKSRHRHSVQLDDSSQATQEDTDSRRNLPVFVSKPTKEPIMPSVPVAKVMSDGDQSVKLKRTNDGLSKRGPMKAVIPVQSMTKDSLVSEGKPKYNTSPVERHSSEPLIKTPNKDNSQIEMRPVASSTPNKSVTDTLQGLMTTAIVIHSKKRRSLGSSTLEYKNRTLESDSGPRQRSHSASGSGIPTPKQDLLKKSHKTSQFKNLLKPKSTSSLSRMTSNNSSQVNSPNDTKAVKTAKQTKTSYNPRALNEVKPHKSPRTNCVKSVVSTISGFAARKGKKIASGDKENRVPC